jgi:Histidinol phosphatase and related hydrolases of the PHP family
MIDLIDIHTHSLACGHAYSTLQENIEQAVKLGLKYYGLSEHAPAMSKISPFFFLNSRVYPEMIENTRILKGVELNIISENGEVDLDDTALARMDYALAALHLMCFSPQTKEINTNAYVNTIKNPYIKVIAHPDDARYLFDAEILVKTAKEYHVALEVNNSSLSPTAFRLNARETISEVLSHCVKYQVPIIMGSDAHIAYDVANHQNCLAVLNEVNFPTDLIINYHQHLIEEYILRPKTDFLK